MLGGGHLSPVVEMQNMYSFKNFPLISPALLTLNKHIVMMTAEGTTKFVNCMTHWTEIHVVLQIPVSIIIVITFLCQGIKKTKIKN